MIFKFYSQLIINIGKGTYKLIEKEAMYAQTILLSHFLIGSIYSEIRFLPIPGTIIAGRESSSFYPWKTDSLEMSVQANYEFLT